jgi:hypothetical protein
MFLRIQIKAELEYVDARLFQNLGRGRLVRHGFDSRHFITVDDQLIEQ